VEFQNRQQATEPAEYTEMKNWFIPRVNEQVFKPVPLPLPAGGHRQGHRERHGLGTAI